MSPEVNTSSLSIKKSFNWIINQFLEMPKEKLILRLSLVFILTFTKSDFYIHYPLAIMALYMLFVTGMTNNRFLWMIQSLGHFLLVALQWDYIDNHKYLSAYWIFTCWLSLYAIEPAKMLKRSANLLIGTIFLLAVGQKVFRGQWLDGSFMHYTYLTDSRFELFVGWLSGITIDILPQNYRLIWEALSEPYSFPGVALNSTPFIRQLAFASSLWTLFIEALVGIVFLLPEKVKLYRYKHAIMFFFIASTYMVVNVAGFHYILILMGITSTEPQSKRANVGYLVLLILFELRKVPFGYYFQMILSNF